MGHAVEGGGCKPFPPTVPKRFMHLRFQFTYGYVDVLINVTYNASMNINSSDLPENFPKATKAIKGFEPERLYDIELSKVIDNEDIANVSGQFAGYLPEKITGDFMLHHQGRSVTDNASLLIHIDDNGTELFWIHNIQKVGGGYLLEVSTGNTHMVTRGEYRATYFWEIDEKLHPLENMNQSETVTPKIDTISKATNETITDLEITRKEPTLESVCGFDPREYIEGAFIGVEEGFIPGSPRKSATKTILTDVTLEKKAGPRASWWIVFEHIDGKTTGGAIDYIDIRKLRDGSMMILLPLIGTYRILKREDSNDQRIQEVIHEMEMES